VQAKAYHTRDGGFISGSQTYFGTSGPRTSNKLGTRGSLGLSRTSEAARHPASQATAAPQALINWDIGSDDVGDEQKGRPHSEC
jgi:hypothetical protein